jgi:hypothetical protein
VLGPEQVNLNARSSPIFLEGVVAIKISEQMAKQLGLRDNQVVRGVIESRGDLLKLILNNKEIDWIGSRRYRLGDRVDFRVSITDQGRSLQPITLPTIPSTVLPTHLAATEAPLSERLLQLLYRPHQASVLRQLFRPASLKTMLPLASSGSHPQLIGQLLSSMNSVSPHAVKNALLNSGLFTESQLAKKQFIKQDIKLFLRNLLRVAAVQSQPHIMTEIEQAIDQIESRQLETLQSQQNREISYSFTLPFSDAEPVDIEFKRGRYPDKDEADEWIINLYTDSPSLGQVWLKATLTDESKLAMIMWAESQHCAELARKASSELEYELQAFGLQLSQLQILNTSRPPSDREFSGSGNVVDVRT